MLWSVVFKPRMAGLEVSFRARQNKMQLQLQRPRDRMEFDKGRHFTVAIIDRLPHRLFAFMRYARPPILVGLPGCVRNDELARQNPSLTDREYPLASAWTRAACHEKAYLLHRAALPHRSPDLGLKEALSDFRPSPTDGSQGLIVTF